MSRLRRLVVVGTTVLVLAPTLVRADDLYVPWTELLPGLTAGYEPSSSNDCKKGHESCVHSVIREMERRFDRLARECDHDAVFSLTYLRTTEIYHDFWHEGHFAEPNWLNHYDAVFAAYYFDAYDAWAKGRFGSVPEAWRIAFDAADRRQVSGLGNVFLGMNAHINRDLPFVLAAIGMVAPDGTSRKGDHDTVNRFLSTVADQVFPEIAERFDPTVSDASIEGTTLDDFLSFQIVASWRETAWRNAERLVSTKTSLGRALVTADIEASAALAATTLKSMFAYHALSTFDADARDAYCAEHRHDT